MEEKSNIYTLDTKMKCILKEAKRIATTQAPVLIQGESGTGKELLAKYIHLESFRSSKNIVALNCATLPENLLESELFGYEKGAFTGAERKKRGKFEAAHGSTFLLDEIGEMPLFLQAKLLRVIQEKELDPLGGETPIPIDIRWIATTNRDLEKMVKKDLFREDLYYRLSVIPFYLPPLRKRPYDIDLLSDFFLRKICLENNIELKQLSIKAKEKLSIWSWPGNIRELRNTIERSILLCKKREISENDILIKNFSLEEEEKSLSPGMTLYKAEKILILQTLEHTRQNRSQAAQILGINVRTLRNKLNDYSKGGRL